MICKKVTLVINNKQIGIRKKIMANGKTFNMMQDNIPTIFQGQLAKSAKSAKSGDFSKIEKFAKKEAKRLKCDFAIENTLDLSKLKYIA